jgi:2-polyprenyl-3-methyl-5-hydroxy-6-metoxy-1,4-benzoquinol methylase
LLDVGVGVGLLHNYFLAYPEYNNVVGIDIEISAGFIELSDRQDLRCMNVEKLLFDDNSFDLVTCFHVLEHLATDSMHAAILNLRRVCNNNLYIGLPINEPKEMLTLTSHQQQFDLTRLKELFPLAQILVFDYPLLDLPGITNSGGFAIIKETHGYS